ncbi:putative short-chain dehydrogenase [Aspergillus steynii IBT 23096]|uniref:Putative short-chain dehydrogenase n=1 Tax=Aspergillus steynii IBT 23096 TaxID=1392250 RepID=A0A2I2GME1_9EURO|nr:putative short-chain dehydrogenase [Aspergillus steynii IBT 23096]PLB54043.1 putative short-chain dehydrogenase [Aspergillus steynii IBT 23096]
MRQPKIPPTPSGTSVAGKTVLITGANTGIGFESARQFLLLQASRVIITARDASKGKAAVESLRQDPEVIRTNPSAMIETLLLDLDDYQSGVSFTRTVRERVSELDILLFNGGMNIMEYQTSKTGHERVMQVNCYTHFLIALELLPLLQATATKRGTPSRLTFVGSSTQFYHSLAKAPIGSSDSALEYWDDGSRFHSMHRYMDSKLVVNAFVRHLATVVPSSEVVINNFCPGMVVTDLNKHLPSWLKPLHSAVQWFLARSLQDAGRTAIHATAVTGEETHGEFLDSNRIKAGPPFLAEKKGEELIAKLWSEMLEEVKREDPDFKAVF